MSMDLIAENGSEFSISSARWAGAWSYVQDMYPTIAELVPGALSNDGARVNDLYADLLGRSLLHDVQTGTYREWIERRNRLDIPFFQRQVSAVFGLTDVPDTDMYMPPIERFEQLARFMIASGGFAIY